MVRKEATKGNYYYECPSCHNTVGKPKEEDNGKEERKTEEETG